MHEKNELACMDDGIKVVGSRCDVPCCHLPRRLGKLQHLKGVLMGMSGFFNMNPCGNTNHMFQ